MEEISCVPSYFVFMCFVLKFGMVLILFFDYYRSNISTYMDFEIHFCWVSFFIFVVVSIIDLEYLENNMLKNKVKK